MNTNQKLEIIKQYPLFADLPKDELLYLAEKAAEKVFPPNTVILSQNSPAEEVLLIYKGLIKIYIINEDGKNIPIRTKGPLYIIGEINIVDDERTATLETIQETHALSFSLSYMKQLLLKYPSFGFNLLKIVVEKLRVANKQTEYYFSASLKERTWAMIQAMASHFLNSEISLSQEELADIVGATRGKVTEVLQELQNEKLISLDYRKIRVL